MKEAGVDIFSYEYCLENSKMSSSDIDESVEFCAGNPDKNGDSTTEKGNDACQGFNKKM